MNFENADPINLEKIKRLVSWANGKKQYPIVAELYPTQKCNLKCIYCWQRNMGQTEKRGEELEPEDWIRIIKELGKSEVKRALITGGEPLCRADASEIFKQIKKEGIEGHLVTNGTLFDKKLIKLLIEIGWDSVAFSLDSADEEINDSLRGKGSFKNITNTIKVFNALKKDKFSKPALSINTTLTSKNYKGLPDLVKLANSLGLIYISILPLVAYHEEGKKLLIGKNESEQLQKCLAKANQLAEDYRIPNSIKDVIEQELTQKAHNMDTVLKHDTDSIKGFNPICFHPFILLTIKEDGTISPCPVSGIKGEKFEKNKNLDSLWFGKTFTEFREAMLKHEFPPCCSICCIPKVLETKYLESQVKNFLENGEKWKSE